MTTTWTIVDGKIVADGQVQDMATYLWTLVPDGQHVAATRKLLLDARRMPVWKRLGFGAALDATMLAARRAIGQVETVELVRDGQPCTIPAQYRTEVGAALRKMDASRLADFLGL